MVVEARCGENHVRRTRYVSRLDVLARFLGTSVGIGLAQVMEHYVARTDILHRCHTYLKMLRKACFAEHSDIDSGVPTALVDRDKRLMLLSVFTYIRLRSDVCQFHILQVCAHNDTEVKRAQVGIRAVLNRTYLCVSHAANHVGHGR